MEALHQSLLALQELDQEITRTEQKLSEFEPQLAELDAPVETLTREVEGTRTRLAELRQDLARLEKAGEQKRARLQQYEERLMRVRNAREEAAARTEMDLVRRAVDADVAEARQVAEQVTRTDLKLDELEKQLAKLRQEATPRREELLVVRRQIEEELAVVRDRRENHAVRLDAASRRLYERMRSGRSRVVLAPLTDEGACGACFNMLPLQEQSEVRRGQTLRRCEGCGVILYVA
ncbi:MAG TPA: C4-type zinc ribbon domain-containing protein [Longimicrobiales bacterium]|nr:C4-type zinc ribbon domain-containing protein [Longimicrobiales bacterium]